MENMNEQNAVDFKLETPMDIAVKGDYKSCDTITLFAPAGAHRSSLIIMKSFIGPMFKKMGESATEEQKELARKKAAEDKKKGVPEKVMTGHDLSINAALMDIDPEKMEKALNAFCFAVTKGGRGKMDGEDVTMTMLEKVSYDDLEKMFYQYCVSFLLKSLTS